MGDETKLGQSYIDRVVGFVLKAARTPPAAREAPTEPRVIPAKLYEKKYVERPPENVLSSVSPGKARPSKSLREKVLRWKPNIMKILAQHPELKEVDPNLILAIIASESGGDPKVQSAYPVKGEKNCGKGVQTCRAVGLMQLIPTTAMAYNLPPAERTNPDKNLLAGMKLINDNLRKTQGDVAKALAGYNGPIAWVFEGEKDFPSPEDAWLKRFLQETRNYVPKVLGFYIGFQEAAEATV